MTAVRPTETELPPAPKWRAVFLVAIALLLLSGGLAIHQYFRFSAASDRIDRTYQVVGGIDELLARLLEAETGVRGYLLTGSQPFLAPYSDAEPRIDRTARALATLVADDPRQHARAQRLIDLSRDCTNELRVAVDEYKGGQSAEAVARIASGGGKGLMDQIRTVSAEMKGAELSMLEQRAYEASLARRISLVFAIASLLLAGTLGVVSVAVDRGFEKRRLAVEREMAGRLRAESSMLSATQELVRTERINRSILDNSGDCIQVF
jgi:CHASE3 domain sensor protein